MSSFTEKQIKVDTNLSKILNVPKGSYVSFADVTKKVYDYVKMNNLRIPSIKTQSRQKNNELTPRFCFNCGSVLDSNSKFCNICGRKQ